MAGSGTLADEQLEEYEILNSILDTQIQLHGNTITLKITPDLAKPVQSIKNYHPP